MIGAPLRERVSETSLPALAVGVTDHGVRSFATGPHGGAVTESSTFRIASLTKPFTAAATALALHAEGIPLDTPAVELVPSLASDWKAGSDITVEHLLAQISGLRESVESAEVAALGDGETALHEAARLVVRAGSDRAPGERWSYYNGNYFLAGAVLAAVTASTYESAVTETMLGHRGGTATGFDTPAAPIQGWDGPNPLPVGPYPRGRRPSGGLWSCAADLVGFFELLLATTPLLDEMQRPRTPAASPTAYGLGWAIGPSGQLYANGRLPGYRAAVVLVPDRAFGAVALANRTQALPEIAGLLSDLQRPLTGDDLQPPLDAFAA